MRLALSLALLLAGCQAGAVATQFLDVRSGSTAIVQVRIGPFVPGHLGVEKGAEVAQYALPPHGSHTFTLPLGRYSIEGVAVTTEAEAATSNFTLVADERKTLILHEVIEETPSPTTGPAIVERTLAWEE